MVHDGPVSTNLTIGRVFAPKREVGELARSIASLAEGQHGVIARRQLIEAGMGKDAIRRRVERKSLQPLLPGVYAVGHRVLRREARWMAAVLASGPGAVLSHRTAGALHRIHNSERLEVTVARPRRPLRAIHMHHSSCLPMDERTEVKGIPVTTCPRTLLDLATVLSKHQIERAVHEAEYQQILDKLSLPDLIARYPRGTGSRRSSRRSRNCSLARTSRRRSSRNASAHSRISLACSGPRATPTYTPAAGGSSATASGAPSA